MGLKNADVCFALVTIVLTIFYIFVLLGNIYLHQWDIVIFMTLAPIPGIIVYLYAHHKQKRMDGNDGKIENKDTEFVEKTD